MGEVIGEGGFGIVRKVVLADGSLVAIKTIRCGLRLQYTPIDLICRPECNRSKVYACRLQASPQPRCGWPTINVCNWYRTARVAFGLSSFRREMELWSQLRHPNIVR